MKDVAAIIINKNTKGFLRECLETVLAQDYVGKISVWVVDNGSDDGSPQMVLGEFPGVNLVWNESNVGYARACNQGIRTTCEPYVLIMNSDTTLSRDTVTEVTGYLESNPRAGVVAPLLRNTDGSLQYSCREFPSISTAFVHAFLGLFSADNPQSAKYKKMSWDHERPCEVPWVSGAFMALRREALVEIGGFDEKYFMYVEDVDLCWRMWRASWSVGYVPRGEVYHHIGMSSRAVPTRMVFHHHVSMLRFHRKTYEGPMRGVVNAAVALGVAARFGLIVALNTYYRIRSALGGAAKVIMPGRQ
ncbi:MAG TPA: glycosyltransferase family 2 protein [Candidatus Anoxymicrobiaceae bacterium]